MSGDGDDENPNVKRHHRQHRKVSQPYPQTMNHCPDQTAGQAAGFVEPVDVRGEKLNEESEHEHEKKSEHVHPGPGAGPAGEEDLGVVAPEEGHVRHRHGPHRCMPIMIMLHAVVRRRRRRRRHGHAGHVHDETLRFDCLELMGEGLLGEEEEEEDDGVLIEMCGLYCLAFGLYFFFDYFFIALHYCTSCKLHALKITFSSIGPHDSCIFINSY